MFPSFFPKKNRYKQNLLHQQRSNGGVDTICSASQQPGHTLGKDSVQRVVCGVIWIRDVFFPLKVCVLFHKVSYVERQRLHSEPPEQETLFHHVCWRQQRPVNWLLNYSAVCPWILLQPTFASCYICYFAPIFFHWARDPRRVSAPIMQPDWGLTSVQKEDPALCRPHFIFFV